MKKISSVVNNPANADTKRAANSMLSNNLNETVCSQKNDFFLARPVKIHPFNRTKLDLTLQLAHKLKFKMADTLAYGNSSHDLPLLSAVGTPVVVRPDANLLQVARKLKWEIVGERK